MKLEGGCHCGAVRYRMSKTVAHHTLCHCADCRRCAGAPAVAWALVADTDIEITGETRAYASSAHGRRHFCVACGTGLFYTNAQIFPGMTDVQSATLDDPAAIGLQAQIQLADRIAWMEGLETLPGFDRYPPMPEA